MNKIERILVVDDAPIIRSLLCDVLRSEGYHTDEACDGVEALEMIAGSAYDLVFCDIHMPRKNGFETLAAAKRIAPDLHFVMTDSLPDQLAERACKLGAVCCLTKPFELSEVRQVLSQIESARSRCRTP